MTGAHGMHASDRWIVALVALLVGAGGVRAQDAARTMTLVDLIEIVYPLDYREGRR